MKQLITLLLMSLCYFAGAQKMKSDNSYIRFYSEAPLEDIEAVNEASTSIIDIEARTFVFVVPIVEFQFEKSLMQEHFNENYLESEKYPKAIFKGKIDSWDGSNGKKNVTASGEMEIHGVTRNMTIESSIDYSGDKATVESVFMVNLEDHKIKIPKAVFYKIAEEIEVTIKFEYKPI